MHVKLICDRELETEKNNIQSKNERNYRKMLLANEIRNDPNKKKHMLRTQVCGREKEKKSGRQFCRARLHEASVSMIGQKNWSHKLFVASDLSRPT